MSRARAEEWWNEVGEECFFILFEVDEPWTQERAQDYIRHYYYLWSLP